MTMTLLNTPYKMVKSDMVSLTSFVQSPVVPTLTKIYISGNRKRSGVVPQDCIGRCRGRCGERGNRKVGRCFHVLWWRRYGSFIFTHGGLCHSSFLSQMVSATITFFLAMSLYPEVQAKAQSEIDRVIGTNRLPRYEDRNSLPYLNALIKEVLRWNPVAPLGKE